MGFLQGIQVSQNKKAEDRRERQSQLTNLIKGFEIDSNTGQYAPNERGQLGLDAQQQQMESKLKYLEEQNQMMQSNFNTDTMTRSVTHLVKGNAKDAQMTIDKNPSLKETLKQKNVHQVAPIDWQNDQELWKNIPNMNIKPEDLQDPAVVAALNTSFSKVQGADGKWRLSSTENLVQSTNTLGYMPSNMSDAVINRFNRAGEILNGRVITNEEQKLKDTQLDSAQSNANLQRADLYMAEEFTTKFFEENPNPTMEQFNAFKVARAGGGGTDYKTMKAMYDAELSKMKVDEKKTEMTDAKNVDQGTVQFLESLASDMKVTNESLKMGKKIQGDKKMTTEERKETFNKFAMVDGFIGLNKELQNMDVTDTDKNMLTKFRDNVAQLAGTDMVPGDREKILRGIDLKTKVGAMVAKYVKFMSGAAVTEGERAMYMDLAQAGNWSTLEPMKTSMRAFTQSLMDDTEASFNAYRNVYPHDYQLALGDLNKYRAKVDEFGTVNDQIDQKPPMANFDPASQPGVNRASGRPSLSSFNKGN